MRTDPCGADNSLAFAIMHDVAAELDDTAAWGRFLTERCLGVLTKVDKVSTFVSTFVSTPRHLSVRKHCHAAGLPNSATTS
jgi:hypothetical protein